MLKKIHKKLCLPGINLLVFVFIIHPVQAQTDPLGLLLTWQQDPTSTMTIDWHTYGEDEASFLEFKMTEDEAWQTVSGEHFPFPFSERRVHRVELTGLEADTEYHFRPGEYTRVRKFRTMPETANRPIRFAVGGDVRHRTEWMERTNRRAAAYEPDFIVWGGDLAYANGLEERLSAWYEFMDAMMYTLVTADGRTIPVLAGIGNHEVRGGYYYRDDHESRENLLPFTGNGDDRERIAPYYYKLFAFPGQPGYGVLDFGDYMSMIFLDTDHTNPIDGEQTEWLETILAERNHVPHVFPNYHVPAYPSVRNAEWETSVRVRESWVPLFEEYGIRVAFENHDHAYKRTYPVREDRVQTNGIVYFGDGAWGVDTRDPGRSHDVHAWYLKRTASDRHFILATVHGNHQHYLVLNEHNEIIDEYPRTTHLDFNVKNLADPWEPATDVEQEDEQTDDDSFN